jgi:hypothetical protein
MMCLLQGGRSGALVSFDCQALVLQHHPVLFPLALELSAG